MNLYLRLLWTLVRVRFMDRLSIDQSLERQFQVLPNDLDLNGHMNNGRYMTLLDLMLIEYFARIGFLKVLIRNKWRPMSGGAVVTYRKGLKPFQQYRIRYALAASDTHWNYMRFEFLTMDGNLCAAGYMKGAAVSRDGLVPNRHAYGEMGLEFSNHPVPDAVVHWQASEDAMIKELSLKPA